MQLANPLKDVIQQNLEQFNVTTWMPQLAEQTTTYDALDDTQFYGASAFSLSFSVMYCAESLQVTVTSWARNRNML